MIIVLVRSGLLPNQFSGLGFSGKIQHEHLDMFLEICLREG